MPIIFVVLGTFALCFAVDKGFTKLFRGKKEHKSGLCVKLNKKYGLVGILLGVLGVAALLAGIRDFRTYLIIYHYYVLARTDEQVARTLSISRVRALQIRQRYFDAV